MKQNFLAAVISLIAVSGTTAAMAATPVKLSDQPAAVLGSFMPNRLAAGMAITGANVEETSRAVDFNQTTHIRVRQTYAGYPVWGSDAVIHVRQGVKPDLNSLALNRSANNVSMNGTFYRNLQTDLKPLPASVATKAQAAKAEQAAVAQYNARTGKQANVSDMTSELIVYIDKNSTAHWAYQVRFMDTKDQGLPSMPIYILDAVTFDALDSWNDLKTAASIVNGGGVGGNPTMGKQSYDGLSGNRPVLKITRDDAAKSCYLKNDTVTIIDKRNKKNPTFSCPAQDPQHNNVYWNTLNDEFNGGYSPNDDALYSDSIVREMYLSWFKVNMLQKRGKPQQVIFYVHDNTLGQNAYYENGTMTFGEGDDESYPVVAPSIVAHEMSHGFTEQHSNLTYRSDSGSLNESFSDMADKAVEYYVSGQNNWNIDPEVLKPGGRLLRYMDEPTKDCDEGEKPGENCSINNYSQYADLLNYAKKHIKDPDQRDSYVVHFASGIFNKAFTIIAGSPNWNTHKAFEVMTQANMNYWTADTSFADAACGVVKAARDYKYDEATIKNAMSQVGVTVGNC